MNAVILTSEQLNRVEKLAAHPESVLNLDETIRNIADSGMSVPHAIELMEFQLTLTALAKDFHAKNRANGLAFNHTLTGVATGSAAAISKLTVENPIAGYDAACQVGSEVCYAFTKFVTDHIAWLSPHHNAPASLN